MKKLILTALLSGIIYISGICQGPTLSNYNIVPKIGDIQVTIKVDTSGITFNNTGPNYIWDYSNLKMTTTKGYGFYFDPETTPYISSFNNSTLVSGASGYYSYYYADTNEYNWMGNGTPSYVMINTDPMKICIFPLNYGDQMTDSMFATYTLSSKVHQYSGTHFLIADGWGTLKLPKNTYSNVLRTKSEQYVRDTVDGVKTESFYTIINWYDGINKVPLLRSQVSKIITYGNPTPTLNKSIYVAEFTEKVSIPSLNNLTLVNICPNPANKELNIELNLKQKVNVDISLIDLLGNIVKPIYTGVLEFGKYQNTIDISGLTKGIYAVKIIAGVEVQVKRIVIQ